VLAKGLAGILPVGGPIENFDEDIWFKRTLSE
jgi:hypothetical protein